MNNASANIPCEVRFQLCSNKCELYKDGRCKNPCQDDCERLFALAQQYDGNIKEQMEDKCLEELSAKDLYRLCTEAQITVESKRDRKYYIRALLDNGCFGELEEKIGVVEDVVKDPSHYQHGTFEVIDEMVIMFGMEKTIVFCQLNAWKYRARAPYKNKFDEDMAKANRYLEMAYELQQIRQEYPEADGYEVCALLKGRKKEG